MINGNPIEGTELPRANSATSIVKCLDPIDSGTARHAVGFSSSGGGAMSAMAKPIRSTIHRPSRAFEKEIAHQINGWNGTASEIMVTHTHTRV
jgi:hypothetical protein